MLERFQLKGRTALVTGSARGIGRAIALALAECGATVAVHGLKAGEPLADTLAEVRKLSPDSIAVAGDLAQPDAVKRILADTVAAIGSPDILVLNASIQIRKPWSEITLEESLEQMQVNFHASLQLIQDTAPAMAARKWGRIVTIGSVQQYRPHPQMPVYAASKSALENLVRNLAVQLAPDGITLNNVAPGAIATDRNQEVLANPAYLQAVLGKIPLARIGTPEDCAGVVLLLCSDAGSYLTGADLRVDGGMSLNF
ncbi:SDR family oxidoreductase [bacterium]|nr:SDR family oxidoreductase [bacterium]